MQQNTKLFIFSPNIADALLAWNLMTKGTGLQKHEHSSEIKTNCYFWTPRNCTCYVFSTNNIMDIFKWIGWFANGFFTVLFLAMMLKIRVNKGSYLCKEVANLTTDVLIRIYMWSWSCKNIFRFSLSACFLFFLWKACQLKKIVTIIKRTRILWSVLNNTLIGGQSGMFAPRCELHADKSPIWEDDNWEVSVSGVLYAEKYGISLKSILIVDRHWPLTFGR